MSPARRRKPEPVGADLGAQPWRIVVADEPEKADPDDPRSPTRTIRRARTYDPVRKLWRDSEISDAQWFAAERFRTCHALAEGAREQAGGARLEPWQRCHYAARVADARAEVRASLQAVGLRLSAVFVGAVIQQQPLRAIERDLNMRNGTAADRVREALETLAQWQAGR